MPIPIKFLFEVEDSVLSNIHKMPDHEDIYQMSKGWPYINVNIGEFPEINYPEIGTEEYMEDLKAVQNSFLRPSCSKKFLAVSNEKPFKLFESYVKNNNLDYDMKNLDDLNSSLANLITTLKFKYNRPRPYKQMQRSNVEFPYNKIEPNDSPSFPSGHTAHAYFNARMIADKFPDHEMKLRTLAEMISQSRLDLGKHYPSDISFGKFVGEYCVNKIKEKHLVTESRKSSPENFSRHVIKNAEIQHNEDSTDTTYLDELCEFLIRSNAIERYSVSVDEALDAAKSYLNGLPVKYCTNNKFIRSHLDALDEAAQCDTINTPQKICNIHQKLGIDVLERGKPGVIRDFEHYARSTGHQYAHPNKILSDLLNWCNESINDDPFTRHIKYECIHPFSDGNGRSGRIILASDLNFNLKNLNKLIGRDYIPMIVNYQDEVAKGNL